MTDSDVREPTWPDLHRARRAIVVVDLVESVRLMQEHEEAVIEQWRRFVHAVRVQVLPAQGGRLVKSLGDGMLLAFDSVRQATQACMVMQQCLEGLNVQRGGGEALSLRIGAHWTDVVEDELDVYGAGVNLAARLAGCAQPGAIVLSAQAADGLCAGLDADLEDLGDLYLKHLSAPVRAYCATPPGATAPGLQPRHSDDLRPSLAIVPFTGRDGGDPMHVLGDLLADEITLMVSRSPEWRVISKLSAAALAGRALSLAQMGQHLRADYLATGAYHSQGDVVHLHVQLLHVGSGEVLWAERFSARMAEVMTGQAELFVQVCDGLAASIVGHGLRSALAMPLPQLRSHELLLGAVALMHRARRQEFDRALDLVEHLQQRHPRAAQPNAWRAKWHVLRVVQGWSPDPTLDGHLALQAGRRATDADASSSLALALQGLAHAYLRQDFDAAGLCYDDALAQNPNEALALLLRGTMHAFLARGEEAYAQTQQALRLSPLDPLRYFYLSLAASAAISAGRYDEAIVLAQRSLRANRMHLSTYRALAMAQALSGRGADAQATVQQLLHYEPGFTVGRFRERFPGRERAPAFTDLLADALAQAGLPP